MKDHDGKLSVEDRTTDTSSHPEQRKSRPSRLNAGALISKLIQEENKSLKVFEKEAVEELIQQGVRIDRKREKSSSTKASRTPQPPKAQHVPEEPEEEVDQMLGCPKCKFSKGGCEFCKMSPMVTRPVARWDKAEGHPQHDIPSAKTVYPTHEEFRDPISYIQSLRALGEEAGIVCVVPPEGWRPPFALHPAKGDTCGGDIDKNVLRFQVRKQYTSHLCMRGASSSFQTESRASRMGGDGLQCHMGGGGRMSSVVGGRMGCTGKHSGSKQYVETRDLKDAEEGVQTQDEQIVHDLKLPETAAQHSDCEAGIRTATEITKGVHEAENSRAGNQQDSYRCQLGAWSKAGEEARTGIPHIAQVDDKWKAPAVKPGDSTLKSLIHNQEHELPAVTEGKLGCRAYLQPHPLLDLGLSKGAELADASLQLGTRSSKRERGRKYSRWGDDEYEGAEEENDGLSKDEEAEDLSGGAFNQPASVQSYRKRPPKGVVFRDEDNLKAMGKADELMPKQGADEGDELAGEFGHGLFERRHTLQSFMAYAEWSKALHFSATPSGEAAPAGRGSWVPANWMEAPWLLPGSMHHEKVYDNEGATSITGSGIALTPGQEGEAVGKEGESEGEKVRAQSAGISSTKHPATGRRVTRHQKQVSERIEEESKGPSIGELEAEFWRIVETASSGKGVETLYGSDLDSGRHGSGFPLPHWRGQQAVDRMNISGAPKKVREQYNAYRRHPWNINCLTRSKDSVLRYVKCNELVTGVMMPWLYVGSCMSAFCWHVEDHALYSINYLHMGAPKVWYGVPSTAAEAFDEAMKDALPHLFKEDPLLLHRLVTMISPNELKARGVPVYRLVHQPGSFVITFPNAYHAGFNTGFNCAEAVNFAPPEWLPYGSDVVRKYRSQGKALTLSHDQLLLTLVSASSRVATARRKVTEASDASVDIPGIHASPHESMERIAGIHASSPHESMERIAGTRDCEEGALPRYQEMNPNEAVGCPDAADNMAEAAEILEGSSGHDVMDARNSRSACQRNEGACPQSSTSFGYQVDEGWMTKWDDGVSLKDVPESAVLWAVGELSVRVAEEETRRKKAVESGVLKETAMSNSEQCELDKQGVHVDTADCDCEVCKCDLYMSAVVSDKAPGRCVCPEHVTALGAEPANCKLLYRQTLEELKELIEHTQDLFPEAQKYIRTAHDRQNKQPSVVAKKLGPIKSPGAVTIGTADACTTVGTAAQKRRRNQKLNEQEISCPERDSVSGKQRAVKRIEDEMEDCFPCQVLRVETSQSPSLKKKHSSKHSANPSANMAASVKLDQMETELPSTAMGHPGAPSLGHELNDGPDNVVGTTSAPNERSDKRIKRVNHEEQKEEEGWDQKKPCWVGKASATSEEAARDPVVLSCKPADGATVLQESSAELGATQKVSCSTSPSKPSPTSLVSQVPRVAAKRSVRGASLSASIAAAVSMAGCSATPTLEECPVSDMVDKSHLVTDYADSCIADGCTAGFELGSTTVTPSMSEVVPSNPTGALSVVAAGNTVVAGNTVTSSQEGAVSHAFTQQQAGCSTEASAHVVIRKSEDSQFCSAALGSQFCSAALGSQFGSAALGSQFGSAALGSQFGSAALGSLHDVSDSAVEQVITPWLESDGHGAGSESWDDHPKRQRTLSKGQPLSMASCTSRTAFLSVSDASNRPDAAASLNAKSQLLLQTKVAQLSSANQEAPLLVTSAVLHEQCGRQQEQIASPPPSSAVQSHQSEASSTASLKAMTVLAQLLATTSHRLQQQAPSASSQAGAAASQAAGAAASQAGAAACSPPVMGLSSLAAALASPQGASAFSSVLSACLSARAVLPGSYSGNPGSQAQASASNQQQMQMQALAHLKLMQQQSSEEISAVSAPQQI